MTAIKLSGMLTNICAMKEPSDAEIRWTIDYISPDYRITRKEAREILLAGRKDLIIK